MLQENIYFSRLLTNVDAQNFNSAICRFMSGPNVDWSTWKGC